MVVEKKCSACLQVLPVILFTKRSRNKDRLNECCKTCEKIRRDIKKEKFRLRRCGIGMFLCAVCNKNLDRAKFSESVLGSTSRPRCKKCSSAGGGKWRSRHREQVNAAARLRREDDLEFFLAKERNESRRSYAKPDSRRKKSSKAWSRRVKQITVDAYGGHCECCGEDRLVLLTMDHINNDGKQDRGRNIYRIAQQAGFPRDRFRLLCWNCNIGRFKNGGTCQHWLDARNLFWGNVAA